MTVYKLIVNLGATLAVQDKNGSFNYFKPSIGAEIMMSESDDLTVINQKFEDLYETVIGPNFKAVVDEFLINSDNKDDEEKSEDGKDDEEKSEDDKDDEEKSEISNTIITEDLPKEEWE
jgi:hypothetical protein